jgi:hypothetical protein
MTNWGQDKKANPSQSEIAITVFAKRIILIYANVPV